MDTTALNPAFIETSLSSSIRLTVTMPLASGGRLIRSWDVMGQEDRRTGLPWRVLGKHQSLSNNATAQN
jgi:hypothetical protein